MIGRYNRTALKKQKKKNDKASSPTDSQIFATALYRYQQHDTRLAGKMLAYLAANATSEAIKMAAADKILKYELEIHKHENPAVQKIEHNFPSSIEVSIVKPQS